MLLSILPAEHSMIVTVASFFLFIAFRLMQNPIGWCCDWLKIPELARGILSQSQYQWLVRAILHQAQGVFPVFVFLTKREFAGVLLYIRCLLPLSHTPSSKVRYIAFSMSFNENKLRTHTLQSKVRYFHVTPFFSMRTNLESFLYRPQ